MLVGNDGVVGQGSGRRRQLQHHQQQQLCIWSAGCRSCKLCLSLLFQHVVAEVAKALLGLKRAQFPLCEESFAGSGGSGPCTR